MKWIVLLSLILAKMVRIPSPVVRVSNGLIRGRVSDDGSFFEFLGIPYAEVSLENRFKGHLPEPKWSGVYEAVNENVKCPQSFPAPIVIGQENCLTINVYTPVTKAKSLSVMVFIHGGGFSEGTGVPFIFGPEYIVRHDVVLVTLNYRLNVLGFLCLGIKEAPGNAGLKDQVAALRWIQRNIAAFNGDPTKVTLFGESAGGASVSFHMLSPLSKGLFSKAILQSGSSIAPWSLQHEPIERAYRLATALGYDTKNPYELYNIFMNQTYTDLIGASIDRPIGSLFLAELCNFVPCVEKNIFENDEAFLTKDPFELLMQGDFNKIPVMMGYNSHEEYYFLGRESSDSIKNIKLENAMPDNLLFRSIKDKNDTVETVKNFYFGNKYEGNVEWLADFTDDPFFTFPVSVESELIMKHSKEPMFYYEFKYGGYLNIVKFISGFLGWPGASHADELFYLFRPRILNFRLNKLEDNTIDKMTTMWTNFSKFGNPTPSLSRLLPQKWLPRNASNPQIFVIDRDFSTKPLWGDRAITMWKKIYSKHRRKY